MHAIGNMKKYACRRQHEKYVYHWEKLETILIPLKKASGRNYVYKYRIAEGE